MRLLFCKTNKAKVEKLHWCLGSNPDKERELSQMVRRVRVCSSRSKEVDYGRTTDMPPAVQPFALQATSTSHLSAWPSSQSSGVSWRTVGFCALRTGRRVLCYRVFADVLKQQSKRKDENWLFNQLKRIPHHLLSLMHCEFWIWARHKNACLEDTLVSSHVSPTNPPKIKVKSSEFQDCHGQTIKIPGPADPSFPKPPSG